MNRVIHGGRRRVLKVLKVKISIYWVLALVYMELIFFISSYPLAIKLPSFSFSDKLVHVAEYGILASLIYLALRERNLAPNKLLGLAVAIAFLYGVSDEIHQHFVHGRQADVFDVVADGIGALCFSLAFHLRTLYQKSRSELYRQHNIAASSS